jgi:8-oxo-dGTP pyrophosphatase MutT (NUDIX family)
MVAAQRELREETGYASQSWQPLVVLAPEPARATHRGHFFFASGATIAGPAQPESSEVIAVRRLPLATLMSEIESGHLIHAAHIAALLLAAKRGLVVL